MGRVLGDNLFGHIYNVYRLGINTKSVFFKRDLFETKFTIKGDRWFILYKKNLTPKNGGGRLLNSEQEVFWQSYIQTIPNDKRPIDPAVHASCAGDIEIADELLQLYLDGKKSAGSSLKKDFEVNKDPLPKPGNFWIVLDSQKRPKAILRVRKVSEHRFKDIPVEVAIAEGEGDLSISYWKKAHKLFFEPYLKSLGISDIEDAIIITEYFDLVYPFTALSD